MPISLTERAAAEIQRTHAEMGASEEEMLRIAITAGGCSGYSYKLDFSKAEQDDAVYDCHGVKVLVDPKSELLLDGTTIDYIDQIDQRGFKIDNPNAVRSCGCGSSFQA
ncbi:MAG: iron-sulfur cluster assembly accessory protein [Planctomycetales bacterium]|nr:iron-sulfur cluster assembly accessory protein [Planctomycetales bacterium]